jgi:hypothetical protein
MDAMAEYAITEFARHVSERQARDPESYHEVMTREVIHELTGEPALEAEPDLQQIFIGNILVENGHAEYDRVSSEVFEQHPDFRAWKNSWVAEEAYHGLSLQEWGLVTGYVSVVEIHERTQGFLRHGLTLNFPTVAHGLAYPALQEPATRITHSEVMRSLPKPNESLAARIGRRTMGLVIADEAAHEAWYTNMVRHALASGDAEVTSAQMLALADATLGFSMPGIEHDIPGGDKITSAYKRTKVFSFQKLGKDILLPAIGPQDKYGWDVANVTELSDEAKRARDSIIQFAQDLLADEGRMARVIIKARRQNGLMATKS